MEYISAYLHPHYNIYNEKKPGQHSFAVRALIFAYKIFNTPN